MIVRYERFRDRILAQLAAYRLDAQDSHLAAVARMLPPEAGPPENLRAPLRYEVKGWVDPGLSPDLRGMREHNPDFRVGVERFERKDIGAGSRYGFRIVATARRAVLVKDEHPVFRPSFVNASGKVRHLPVSHESAAHILDRCDPDRPRPNLKRRRGYIDEVKISIRPGALARHLWVPRLVTENPAALLDFADSPHGEPWRAAFVASMALIPANDRWADRYRLVARGLDADFTSDLEPLVVDRPRPDVPRPSPAVPVLRAERRGALVDFVPTSEPMAAPDTRWLTVDDACVQGGGTVTTGDRLVCYETAADPGLRFVAGAWDASFGSHAHPGGMLLRRMPAAEEQIPEGILLAGRNDDNWYHWLAEYLPRALTIPEEIAPGVPLLVSRRTPPTGIEALLGITDRPVVPIDPRTSQSVGRLHLSPPVAQVLDTGHADWTAGTTIDRAPLDLLRARWGVDQPREGTGRRVFLNRHSSRRGIGNQQHLAEIAADAGLELVDPAGLTFAEQRELFASAELVAGASGGVMANYLLMRPGSTIIALTSEQLQDFVLPPVMATVAGCTFRYVLGRSAVRAEDVTDPNHWIHANFTINEADFAAALHDAVATSTGS